VAIDLIIIALIVERAADDCGKSDDADVAGSEVSRPMAADTPTLFAVSLIYPLFSCRK
jgi:hypothetical protein